MVKCIVPLQEESIYFYQYTVIFFWLTRKLKECASQYCAKNVRSDVKKVRTAHFFAPIYGYIVFALELIVRARHNPVHAPKAGFYLFICAVPLLVFNILYLKGRAISSNLID
jgi:hypothetical protein